MTMIPITVPPAMPALDSSRTMHQNLGLDSDILFSFSASCAIFSLICGLIQICKHRNIKHRTTATEWQVFLSSALGLFLSGILLVDLIRNTKNGIAFNVSMVASLAAALGLSLLLLLQRYKSLPCFDMITLYLTAAILLDFMSLTVPTGVSFHKGLSHPILIRCILHSALLLLEFWREVSTMASGSARSPEEINGILSRVFFTWINPILVQGYKNILVDQDLPLLSRDMKSELTRMSMLRMWDQREKPESKRTLPVALLKCVKWPFLAAILPRLFLIGFRYSQPTLIKLSIRFVVETPSILKVSHGYWLVVSAVFIYVGLAVSTSIYQNRLNRLKLMIRSALVGLIHDKTMHSPSISYDNGDSTTLMSTDVDGLVGVGEMFHETWAQVLEVMIGMILLAKAVGWIWPLPLCLIFLCSRVSRYVAKNLQPRQKAWNSATQSRVAATSSMISSMKTIKMLGFQQNLSKRIQEFREEELMAASKLRWMMVYYNASANALGIFSPAVTLVIFAIIAALRGHSLDAETAFPTIAILSMVTHPANMVMTIVPRAIGTLAAFDRIQTYLLRSYLQDQRSLLPITHLNINNVSGPAVLVENLTLGGTPPILQNINLKVDSGSLTIISGPVGSGKSTLLRGLLGEVTPSQGSIKLSTQMIAYCAQIPWLSSGSIRSAIQGHAKEIDERWYQTVIEKCCLSHDFKSLPNGDETETGSRGINLSGGQRQRVALARAVFARTEIAILDDTLSGLDGETEKIVFENLFSSQGIFRRMKTTVIIVSNSTQYFEAADRIVVLGNRGIEDQGRWQDIKLKSSSIAKFMSSTHTGGNALLQDFDKLRAQVRASDEAEVDLTRKTGDLALYGYYFHFAGAINIILILTWTSSYSFFFTIPQYWLQLWTQSKDTSSVFYICGFLFLSFASWSVTSMGMWTTIIHLAPHSGIRLHQRLLQVVTCAPLSFFSGTDNGSILNRFSQDIQLIDKQLPTAFSSMATQSFKLLMQAILLFISQRWLSLSLPMCMLVVFVVQKVYLRTSRQLRFLELESRAAVFSSFLETIEGLETIRAFNWRREIIRDNILRVENSQRPEFLLLCLQRWLNIVLDLLAAALASSVVAIAVNFRDRISGAQVGVALNIMLVANSTLLKLVENWTELEISLGAVSRLRSLEKMTPCEGGGGESVEPTGQWPSEGRIVLEDVTASYGGDSVVLRNLNLNIDPGQKVIVFGRTGSGKSSLILAFLRILELQNGKIEIDSVDISQVSLEVLRQQCFVTVSQDALILSNETLRFNLDPGNTASDDDILDSLNKTGLWTHSILGSDLGDADADTNSVLNKKISELPELSVGQCQLFALCRAIVKAKVLRRVGLKPIVLLDEVTSSLDHTTEVTIHGIIEREFTDKGHTVIMVAHRIGILTEDKRSGREVVVVLGDGQLHRVLTDLNEETLKTLGD